MIVPPFLAFCPILYLTSSALWLETYSLTTARKPWSIRPAGVSSMFFSTAEISLTPSCSRAATMIASSSRFRANRLSM
ncbi:hypothetical protein LK07_05540 [Streptomyces pluripotens]|uniref:Uncharacterized protein n=1 Tax=Streptomyces pluripotens TaxID=1355015 RepID=A0A221NUB4_9ACTN|nr:hypothetical protein LK07_05540 [Streptomyces pluripotens]